MCINGTSNKTLIVLFFVRKEINDTSLSFKDNANKCSKNTC